MCIKKKRATERAGVGRRVRGSGGSTQCAEVAEVVRWSESGSLRAWVYRQLLVYRNCFAQTSHVVCMVTKLKVLEFFLGLEFFRTCARLKALQRRNSRFWQACATKPRLMAKGQVEGGKAY